MSFDGNAERPKPGARPEGTALEPKPKPRMQKMRDSHHMLARLFALGLRNDVIAARSGYAIGTLQIYARDPLFKELVAHYSKMVDAQFVQATDDYFEMANMARTKSMRLINDKLDDEGEDMSIRELVTIHADTADRTGYPKRSVAVNVNVDFAAKLDQAITRSNKAKVIEHKPTNQPAVAGPPSADAVEGGGVSGEAPPPNPMRRFA